MAARLGVSDILTTLGLDTLLADYEIQKFRQRTGTNFAQRRTRLNDVAEEGVLDTIAEYELELIIKEYGGGALALDLGGVGYGDPGSEVVITKAGVRQVNNDNPRLTLTVHTHTVKVDDAAHHARKYAVTLPALDWGVNAVLSISGTIPDVIQSVTTEATCDHKDELNREGTKWLIGASHNGMIKETIQLTDGVASPVLNSGWKADPTDLDEENVKYADNTLVHHKYLTPS
jgi:hypothetical protein